MLVREQENRFSGDRIDQVGSAGEGVNLGHPVIESPAEASLPIHRASAGRRQHEMCKRFRVPLLFSAAEREAKKLANLFWQRKKHKTPKPQNSQKYC